VDRPGLLKSIAETGYNVGFGAKKHFATYDIVEKTPGMIGFVSLAIGILSLVFEPLSAKGPAAALAIAGVMGLYISLYDHKKMEYERAGPELTQLFNELRALYRSVQAQGDLDSGLAELQAIETAYYGIAISKQILFSDWYAHYKFFAQFQIDCDEQKHFTWRDKVPLSLIVVVVLMVIGAAGFGVRLIAT
jgi:SMODS and SLOG-associating 2TM effector domain 6